MRQKRFPGIVLEVSILWAAGALLTSACTAATPLTPAEVPPTERPTSPPAVSSPPPTTEPTEIRPSEIPPTAAVPVGDLTGTWILDIAASDFGNGPVPQPDWISTFTIEHREPAFSFTVTGTGTDGSPIDMAFQGVVDDTPYPVQKWLPGMKAMNRMWRIDAQTIAGELTFNGVVMEQYRMILAADGRQFTRPATSVGGLTQTLVYSRVTP